MRVTGTQPGQIIIVSGTSGSGKSTTCELLQKRFDDFYLLFGIDHFLALNYPAKFSHHGPRSIEGIHSHPIDENDPANLDKEGPLRWSIGPEGWRGFHVMHEWVATASRAGCNIVLDHLMMSDPPLLQDCVWRMRDLPVLFVNLKPPYEVLAERVANRKMNKRNPAKDVHGEDAVAKSIEKLNRLRPWFYETVYANDVYDLEVDSSEFSVEQVCEKIEARLAEGPGTAFEALRRKWPRM